METNSELLLSVDGLAGCPQVPVRELARDEVEVTFARESAPLLLVGQALVLRFRGARLPVEALVRAFVSARVEGTGERSYRFRLEHGDHAALEAAVNRRGAQRVTPQAALPVPVTLSNLTDGIRVTAVLRDLSESGISVLVGKEDEWTLAATDSLRVEFRLPQSPEVLGFVGLVRHRRLERTAIHYGMAFDTAMPGFEAAREVVRGYIAERREAMRRRIEPSGDRAA